MKVPLIIVGNSNIYPAAIEAPAQLQAFEGHASLTTRG